MLFTCEGRTCNLIGRIDQSNFTQEFRKLSHVNNMEEDFETCKFCSKLLKSCRQVKIMTERNRNIKYIFIMLQRGTNIMANQVKTPISKRCCMKIRHLRFLPCCFHSCQSRDKKNRNKPLRFSLHFSRTNYRQLAHYSRAHTNFLAIFCRQ